MTDVIAVAVIVVGAVGLFVRGRLRPDVVSLLVLVTLALSGLVTAEEAISGFANPATITVLAMLILAAGLARTGVTQSAAQLIARVGGASEFQLLTVLMVATVVLSAFVNNTAVVAAFMPLVVKLAGDRGMSPSHFLIPLSFASMFGGTMTLIGTSTNLLVNTLAQREGLAPFGMFEFARLGGVLTVVGLAYLLLVGRRLLPDRTTQLTERYRVREYLTEIVIREDSDLVGQSMHELDLEANHGVEVIEIFRGDRKIWRPQGATIAVGDVLLVHGPVDSLLALKERKGLEMRQESVSRDEDLTSEDVALAEAVVAPRAGVQGRSARETFFRRRYNLTILAIRQHRGLRRDRLADCPLSVGDTLLLQGPRASMQELAQDRDFLLIGELEATPPRWSRRWIAVGIMVGVAALAASGIVPVVVASLAGVAAMILGGCLTIEDAYEAVDWSVIFLLAGMIPLGIALDRSGGARLLADTALTFGSWLGPTAVISIFYIVASLLTELMSNNATAILLTPVAVASAGALGIDPRPLLFAVAFAASASFMTPVGYQTNLLVFGPGGYRYADYLRVGTPLNILFWLIATVLIPVLWPPRG